MATGLPLGAIEAALDTLMVEERIQVAVSESAVLVYRLHDRRQGGVGYPDGPERRVSGFTASAIVPPPPPRSARRRRWGPRFPHREPRRPHSFDQKTLRLIRARGGVVSIAELVEHTGLTVEGARLEAERLVGLYGGEAHPSWDRHVVYAFPDLVASAHGDFHVREPRPAWVRTEEPMLDSRASDSRHRWPQATCGAVAAGAFSWFATFPPAAGGRIALLAVVAGASAGATFLVAERLLRAALRHPRLRVHRWETLRRYILGHVFETALRGKGVVSLNRTISYLKTRTGGARISRRKVERALRSLAEEFDAPETELDGDRFFGFRNVKRQFLASHVQRVRLQLQRRATGRTLFDSGDAESVAAEREFDIFDRALYDDPGAPPK